MTQAMSFDRVADSYDEMRGGLERGRQSAACLAPHLVAGTTLEVGVGTGVVAAGLRELGHPVIGVDISEPMLHRAHERLGGRVARADARALPLPRGTVANVVFVHVLHLVGDMAAAVAEAARVLRPGGRLAAVHGSPVADPDELVEALDRLAPLQPPRPDTPEGLLSAGEAAGLRPVEQHFAAEYEKATSPAELAESIERRVPPYLWHVPDDVWRDVVVPVVAGLRALPDPDRPRVQTWRSMCTVLEKHG
ncbi:class I SAM-dependent methyltransferase [Microbispora siamensis]